METRLLHTDCDEPADDVVEEAGRVLRDGGLVVIPTETVYGIAVDALNPSAVARLRAAKGRPEDKPLPVMVQGLEDAGAFATQITDEARAMADAFWPGPLTIVFQAAEGVSAAVHAGSNRVGLRAPDHRVARAILRAAERPLALTSANVSGEEPSIQASDAWRALHGRVDLIVDAGACRVGVPSTVVDVTTDPPTVLRDGAVCEEALRVVLRGVR